MRIRNGVLSLIAALMSATVEAEDRAALIGAWQITEFQDDGRDRMERLAAGSPKKQGQPPRVAKLVFTAGACYILRGDGKPKWPAG